MTRRIDANTHADTRLSIPPGEMEPFVAETDKRTLRVEYERRDPGLDPQLIWRGKGLEASPLSVAAPPIWLQEHVHPKALIEDLRAGRRQSEDLFAHFGVPDGEDGTAVEYYSHPMRWSNRMILGDSLQVMASLAEREGLRGQVQMVYIDPPYGIRFNSNFQWSTTSRDVKDGDLDHLTREPEQVRAFRDTWREGVHSYLAYLRDRLVVARELLTESGSCFVQIGDENVHRVQSVMDEVFGGENFVAKIVATTTSGSSNRYIDSVCDYYIWYAKNIEYTKYRPLFTEKLGSGSTDQLYRHTLDEAGCFVRNERPKNSAERLVRIDQLSSQTKAATTNYSPVFEGLVWPVKKRQWATPPKGMRRLMAASRVVQSGESLAYLRSLADYSVLPLRNVWTDTGTGSFTEEKVYVVQTGAKIIQRCILMTTDPGDLVLDPTCGSGTTAHVAEQWGRRWITIDTSRVALALARSRLMGSKYPYYLLADSPEGRALEAEITRLPVRDIPTQGDIRQGFVYARVPHVTLKSIANNPEIDAIWERLQPAVDAARERLNTELQGHDAVFEVATGGRVGSFIRFDENAKDVRLPSGEVAPSNGFLEWEVPRLPGTPWPAEHLKLLETARKTTGRGEPTKAAREALVRLNHLRGTSLTHSTLPDRGAVPWPPEAVAAHEAFWQARIARQRAIDASIAARAETELLYDKPYEDDKRVRVAGPFTVETLSPHRTPPVGADGELVLDDPPDDAMADAPEAERDAFFHAILENLKSAGVHQLAKGDRIAFSAVSPWPGRYVAAEGRYLEGDVERRAAIMVGPEYGTVQRADLELAAREAREAGFDILIACAFNYDAHADVDGAGSLPVLRARMNPDLHMSGDLKAGGGNLFVVFGEPDIGFVVGGTPAARAALEQRVARLVAIDTQLGELKGRKDEHSKKMSLALKAEHAAGAKWLAAAEKLGVDQVLIEIRGVDVFRPQTGEIDSVGPEGIACWFVDTEYTGASFFVRQAYFLGAGDPYRALRATLKDEIDREAWESLNSAVSRPFARPASGKVAVKAINHLGDEVMRVFDV